jgi:hypothetical protein
MITRVNRARNRSSIVRLLFKEMHQDRFKVCSLGRCGLLSVSSLTGFAQSYGNDAPVDKGGMPPSTEMNANSANGNALPPGSINSGNGGDANGSSISPGAGSGGSSMGSGGGSGSGGSGSSGMSGSGVGGSSGSAGGGTGGAGGGTSGSGG